MEDLLSDDILTLTNKLENIQYRLEAWNETNARSRNLSLAITNLEATLDKLYRVLKDT